MSDRVAATQQTADVGRRLEMHAHEMTSRIEESRRNDRDRLRLLELGTSHSSVKNTQHPIPPTTVIDNPQARSLL